MSLLAAACGTQEPAATESPGTTGPSAPTTSFPDSLVTTTEAGLAAAPWSVPPLPAEAAPSILKTEWDAAGNKGICAALYPADANDLAADAVVRAADFGSDAWAMAWDRPEGPGRSESGEPCENCGRGAFGVAGTGGLPPREAVEVWPTRVEWSDGSAAGYGVEGMADPDSGAAYLAYIAVTGQGCTYNVWSFLGEDHLLQLIDELRFVEGMLAKVIDPPSSGAEVSLGPAPWRRTPLGDAAVPPPLLAEWTEEVFFQATCPLLTPVSLGEEAEGAAARRAANAGQMLAAWDLPNGPGRYGTGEYCANCGRGALGLGTINVDAPFETFAVTHTWDDGSELRVISEATEFFDVSPDQAVFTDPQTDEPVEAPLNGYLLIPGLSCGYRVWSFLGVDHLIEFTQNLRAVIGFGDTVFTQGACPAGSIEADIDGDREPELVHLTARDDTAILVVCGQGVPPIEYRVAGTGEILAVGDIDGDGDGEVFIGETTDDAGFYTVLNEGEDSQLGPLYLEASAEELTFIVGIDRGVGYRWGCRDDGTVVQLAGTLSGGSLSWTRAAYRVEGQLAVPVGSGSGRTPVTSATLADALFEMAVTELVGLPRCEE